MGCEGGRGGWEDVGLSKTSSGWHPLPSLSAKNIGEVPGYGLETGLGIGISYACFLF